jgi:nucleoside-diphosphate-sugar epimerase
VKKVLVTGAGGFIGRQSLSPLQAAGYDVHAVSLDIPAGSPDGIAWYTENLLNENVMSSLVDKIRPTHLLHFAWYAVPGKFWNAEENLDWVSASIALTKSFHRAGGKRAVFAGTCAEYEWSQAVCDETSTPLRPANLYGICKNSLQQIVTPYTKMSGISSAWGRIFHLYGPHEAPSRFVPAVIRALLTNTDARCTKGDQLRDFMHVSDVAAAFVALLSSPVEGPVNIISGKPVTLADVAGLIARKLNNSGRLQLGSIPAPPNDPPIIVGSSKRLNDEVGWHPARSLEQGIEETITWWRNNL